MFLSIECVNGLTDCLDSESEMRLHYDKNLYRLKAICVHSIVLTITWKTSLWIFFHYCNSLFDMWTGRKGNYFYNKYLENHKWVKAVFLMSVCTWQHWYKILYKKNFIKIFRLNGRLYRSNYKRAWIRQIKVRFSQSFTDNTNAHMDSEKNDLTVTRACFYQATHILAATKRICFASTFNTSVDKHLS